jgi:hypothetical protein
MLQYCRALGINAVEFIYRIDVFLRRICTFGLCQHIYSFQYVANLRDASLFKEIMQPGHCLHQILPSVKKVKVLHPRGHNFILPKCKYDFYKRSFLNRCLYNFI